MKKVSIVTPSFNQGPFIAEAIESVLAQNDPNFEHIVIDGGSTDNTLEVLKAYPHLKWVSEPDKGQCDAVNKGFHLATGDIFGEINADDYYLPGAFSVVRREMGRHDGCPVVTGGQQNIRDGKMAEVVLPQKAGHRELLRYPVNPVSHPATFYSRKIWEAVGGLDAAIRYAPDVDLFIRMSKICEFKCVGELLAVNRIHEAGIQGRECARNWLATLYHIARHGDFPVFEEMADVTFGWMRGAPERPHSDADDADGTAWLHAAYVTATLAGLAARHQRIVLAGGGRYCQWLLRQAATVRGLTIVALMDDAPKQAGAATGLGAVPFGAVPRSDYDLIVVCSDTAREQLAKRVIETCGADAPLLELYAGAPAGAFPK